ncbi:hypothetical protein HanRHA438_Chr09g0392951 [Helianthus annuus]|nr:hypothetical protein HanRHA438_Chr09g0392951 [Helianthus annuus]
MSEPVGGGFLVNGHSCSCCCLLSANAYLLFVSEETPRGHKDSQLTVGLK